MELASLVISDLRQFFNALLIIVLVVGPPVIQLTALISIPAGRRPSAAQAWLLLIFFLPWIGGLLYLLIGNPKLSWQRRAQQQYMDEVIAARVRTSDTNQALQPLLKPAIPPRYQSIVTLAQHLGGLPLFDGNRMELLADYQGAINRIVSDINAAQRYVHLEYFMFADDETGSRVVDALIRARARGVICRVLVDHLGDIMFIGRLFKRLKAGGVEAYRMLPVAIFDNEWSRFDLRNHRKIVVIDGQIGFTGSQNLINADYNKPKNRRNNLCYEELVARFNGPVVDQLAAVFATDWYSETQVILDPHACPELSTEVEPAGEILAQVLPSGPGHEMENNLRLFIALIHEARHTLVIATPYFVPNGALLTAITIAAQRGVAVTLIVSGVADQFLVSRAQRSYYEELLEAGVNVRQFQAPVLLHSKTISIDDDIAVVGSSNMDMRSFELDLEISVVLYDQEAVTQLRAIEASYIARSVPVSLEEWQARSPFERFSQNTARLVSAVL